MIRHKSYKRLGDLAGPAASSLGFTSKLQDLWEDVNCRECGVQYRKHGADVADMRKRGFKPICRKCWQKDRIEVAKAIVNTERRRKACKGVSAKMATKARLDGK